MNSQLLIGGRKIEDTPQFRNALEEQQKIIREQYEQRLKDLEKERQIIEEDKAQVDKYKQLLVRTLHQCTMKFPDVANTIIPGKFVFFSSFLN